MGLILEARSPLLTDPISKRKERCLQTLTGRTHLEPLSGWVTPAGSRHVQMMKTYRVKH